jgi:hypothetical protein
MAATPGVNTWMTEIVAIQPDGAIHVGQYDGYGSVGGAEDVIGADATVYHVACWETAGRPMKYQGASPHSADQGWFFDDGAHDLPDPRTVQA